MLANFSISLLCANTPFTVLLSLCTVLTILGHLQDVILPRILDDATLASLNTMIHTNNASVSVSPHHVGILTYLPPFVTYDIAICLQVISLLKDDAPFIRQLFARMRSSDISMESKRELVRIVFIFLLMTT